MEDGLCRVLIVDDELLIRQGIKHYINWEQEGFAVVGEASNGREALALIETEKPHVILTDIVMPVMDGEELTKIVKESYPDIEIIILSSFGDFDYVRSTFQSGVVDYILKPKLDSEGLLKTLKKAASRIPDFQLMDKESEQLSESQIISKLVSGYGADFDQSYLSGVFPFRHYCVLGMDLKAHPAKGKQELVNQLKENVVREFKENVKELSPYIFQLEQNRIGILLNFHSKKMPEVHYIAEQLAKSNSGIGFALTNLHTDLTELGTSVKGEILKLFQYRFYFPDATLLKKEDLPAAPPDCKAFNLDWFTEEFKRKNFEAAFGYLHEHAEALSQCYTNDVFEFKAFFSNIIFNITVLLGNMDYNVKDLEDSRYSYFQMIDQAESVQVTLQQFGRFIEEAKSCISSMPANATHLNMKEIMQFIREHYAEPLTLKDVAKHFHFNPSYLSSYFSAHNDEGFIEYLNRIRIEEAAKLLTMDSAPISEISSMVGYSDHSYFCKVFKKSMGSSPSQYRRKQNLR